jgi:hypothetical protein
MVRRVKMIEHEYTIEGALADAMAEIQSLAEEMRDAYDNTPESLQNGGVGEARGEAADTLENINEPDVPAVLAGDRFKFKFSTVALSPSAMRKRGRSSRRSDAVETLQQLNQFLETLEENKEIFTFKEEQEVASELRDEVQTVIDEAEGVEFPGMYG